MLLLLPYKNCACCKTYLCAEMVASAEELIAVAFVAVVNAELLVEVS